MSFAYVRLPMCLYENGILPDIFHSVSCCSNTVQLFNWPIKFA